MKDERNRPDARRETEADLVFDVQMALRGAPLRSVGRELAQRKDADARAVAQRIVEHLKLCGWRWRRKEPDEAHGSFKPKADT